MTINSNSPKYSRLAICSTMAKKSPLTKFSLGNRLERPRRFAKVWSAACTEPAKGGLWTKDVSGEYPQSEIHPLPSPSAHAVGVQRSAGIGSFIAIHAQESSTRPTNPPTLGKGPPTSGWPASSNGSVAAISARQRSTSRCPLPALLGDLLERPPVAVQGGVLARQRLPPGDHHIHVLRVQLQSVADALGQLRRG